MMMFAQLKADVISLPSLLPFQNLSYILRRSNFVPSNFYKAVTLCKAVGFQILEILPL